MSYDAVDTLYHYTDTAAVRGMLTNKQIWLTDVRNMNDDRELKFGAELFLPRIVSWVRDNFSNDHKDHICDWIMQRSEFDMKNNGIFSASFCEDSDSRHLWKFYGDKGAGVAIGFNPYFIMNLGNTVKVRYPQRSIDEFADQVMNDYIQEFQDFTSIKENASTNNTGDPILDRYGPMILGAIALYAGTKEERWAKEKEVRVVWMQAKPGARMYADDSVQGNSTPRYSTIRTRRNETVEYIEKFIPGPFPGAKPMPGSLPIREFVLGPACQMTEDELSALAVQCGYPDVPVKRSRFDGAIVPSSD